MAGTNAIKRSVAPNAVFESATAQTDATVSYEQGDLLCLLTGLIQKPAAEADGATFLGVARETVVLGKLARPYTTDVDASQAASEIPGPQFGIEAEVISKTGDAWAVGGLVYLDPATGARGVTSAGTKAIGVYLGPVIAAATAGQKIIIRVGHRFPGDTLVL